MKTNNKIILTFALTAVTILSGCNAQPPNEQDQPLNMPNPASVYCEEQGGRLDMRETSSGTIGVCIFPDETECEEWAYFRGECQPGDSRESGAQIVPPFSMQAVAIYGSLISSGTDTPAPSKLVLTPEGFGSLFITGETGELEAQIVAMRDKPMPANKANFWGKLDCPAMDSCLLTVSKMREDGPGDFLPADTVDGWEGVIYSGPPGPRSGGDDYFALLGPMPFQFGIDGADDTLRQQIESLRNSGQAVKIYGEIFAGRMDWNASQIIVTAIELIDADPAQIPPAPES